MRLLTLPGVFSPISDSWMLADALRRETLAPGARVLDLCTGSGALAITAALRGAEATAVDVSRRALLTVKINAALNGVRVRTVRGDLLEAVGEEQFDCIVSNPPYVPSPSDDVPRRGAARAWEAGRSGRLFLDRILSGAPRHLKPGGSLLVVQSTLIGEEGTLAMLREAGLQADVLERRRGALGPLMQRRVEVGVLPPRTREEEVLIVRGRQIAGKSGVEDAGPLAPTEALT